MNKTEKEPKVFIIILNWNGWKDTIDCVESVQELCYQNFQTVVVDNGSQDESVREIKNRLPDIRVLKLDYNKGYAGGNNAGIKLAMEADADFVWILNNDTVVDKNSLAELIKRVKSKPEIGLCGSTLIYEDNRTTIQACGGGYFNSLLGVTRNYCQGKSISEKINEQKIEQSLDYISGAAVLVSSDFIKEIGLMCEDYFLYYEEIDWALRGKNKFQLGYASGSLVYHKEGASIQKIKKSKERRSKVSDYHQVRNRLIITQKYFPHLMFIVNLSLISVILNRIVHREWDRVSMVVNIIVNHSYKFPES